jgi:hypothetical protein
VSTAFHKFYPFTEAVYSGVHDLKTAQIKVALCDSAHAPDLTNSKLSDLTEIAYTHLSSRSLTTISCLQTLGVLAFLLEDLVLAASGGSVAPFRYVVFYNDTATDKDLIGWYDYGSDLTLNDTQTLTITFDPAKGLLTVSPPA